MKKRFYMSMFIGMAFLLMINGIAFGVGHENPPGTMLTGPPIVGTLTLDPVSEPAPVCIARDDNNNCTKLLIFVNYKFTGCCAECSESLCKPACNIKMSKFEPFAEYAEGIMVTETDNIPGLTLGDAAPAAIEDYYMGNLLWLGKNCHPTSKDILIEKVLTMTTKDIDNDGMAELLANIVVLYVVPVPQ